MINFGLVDITDLADEERNIAEAHAVEVHEDIHGGLQVQDNHTPVGEVCHIEVALDGTLMPQAGPRNLFALL